MSIVGRSVVLPQWQFVTLPKIMDLFAIELLIELPGHLPTVPQLCGSGAG